MKTVRQILDFCNQQILEYSKMEEQYCWSCVNALQDVISFIYSENIPMPTEDDERNYDKGWEKVDIEEMLKADQQINFIKSQQLD